jgi:hypothetical protein
VTGLASWAMSLVSGLAVRVAAGDSFQGPGRRRDLGLGRLEDRGSALSAREREGGADVVDRVFGWDGQPREVDRNLALTVIMTAPGGGLWFLFSPDSWRVR